MYLKTTKSGPRNYLQIIQSYRDPETGKPRQRYIANLGRVEELVDTELDSLIDGLLKVTGRKGLGELEAGISEESTVFERALELGDVWAIMQIWKELSLVQAIGRAARRRRFGIDMEKVIRVMTINRLSDPRSKLGVLEWLQTVALPGIEKSEITHTNLLRAMDFLIEQKAELERQLASTLLPLFGSELEVVFYDITTIRVHGEAEQADDVRAFGKPKDGDSPARQFAVGVVQTPEGLPLYHEVFEGNIGESTTVSGVVAALRERFPIKRLVFVADRGMISMANLEEIEATVVGEGRQAEYIVAVPARRYREMTSELASLHGELRAESRATGTEAVRELEVGGRRVIVAYSPAIAKRARTQRAERLVEAWRMASDMADTLNAHEAGRRRRGRPLSDTGARIKLRDHLREHRLTRFLEVDWKESSFGWSWNVEELKRELMLDGVLVLVSNVRDLQAKALVEQYKELADIERGFRVLKNEIEIAPVHHRLPERIRAHAFICFLALVIHRVMRLRLRRAGEDLSPAKLLFQLKAVQQHRVRLATGTVLSGITSMSAHQRHLFQTIGVEPPRRESAAL